MQNEEGELLLERQVKAHVGASTSFDISRSGAYLGSATSEGDYPGYLEQLTQACKSLPHPCLRLGKRA
jgi:hypothetical protein